MEVYHDDISMFGNTWEEHQVQLDKVLSCLESNGFIVKLSSVHGPSIGLNIDSNWEQVFEETNFCHFGARTIMQHQ